MNTIRDIMHGAEQDVEEQVRMLEEREARLLAEARAVALRMARPSTWVDELGYTYLLPHHPGFRDEVPIDMTDFTDWERQEVCRHWRDATREAFAIIECGYMHLDGLLDPETIDDSYHLNLAAGGSAQPNYVATKFIQSRIRLQSVLDGAHHRIAMRQLERNGGDPERTLEVGS